MNDSIVIKRFIKSSLRNRRTKMVNFLGKMTVASISTNNEASFNVLADVATHKDSRGKFIVVETDAAQKAISRYQYADQELVDAIRQAAGTEIIMVEFFG